MVDARLNEVQFTKALVDNGSLCYASVNESLAESLNLPRIRVPTRTLDGVVADQGRITHVTHFDLDVHGHQQQHVFAYIIPGQLDELILGDPWLKDVGGRYSARKGYLDIFTKSGERTRC